DFNIAMRMSTTQPSSLGPLRTSSGLIAVPETAGVTSHVLPAFSFMF
ncbi:hypothetical protein SLEP1_g57937, partial [Rubroshorea leprosula]